MINRWAVITLFLIVVSPVFLVLSVVEENYFFAGFSAGATLIGLAIAIQESKIFFTLKTLKNADKMLDQFMADLDKYPTKKKKQKRCKICGTWMTYVCPMKRSEQKPRYVCYKCSKEQ